MDFKKILEQFDAAEKPATKRTLSEAAFAKSGVKADAKKHKADATTRKQYFVKLTNAKGGNKGVTVMADEGESESEVRSRVARDHKSQGWTVSSIREKGDAADKAAAGKKKPAVTASGKRVGRPPGSTKKVTEGRQTVSEYIAEARLMEKSMTPAQKGKRERIVKGMKKVKGDFEKRYPGRGEAVMYATATKRAMKESYLKEDDSMMGMTLDQAKQHPAYKTDKTFQDEVNAAEKFSSSLSADKKPTVMTTDQAKKHPAYAKDPAFKSRVDKTKPTTGMVVSATGQQQGMAESYQLSKPGTSAEEAVKTLEWDLEEEKEFLSRKQQREVLKIISMLKAGDVDGARDYKVNVCSQDMSEWIDEALDQRWNPFADDDYSLYADRLGEGADKESQMWGGFIGKFFDAIYGYGDDGLEHLDGAAPLWAKLWAKHNGDIDAIIANEPAAVLNKAAKELKSVLDDLQSGLMEGSDKQSQQLGGFINKFFGEIAEYGNDGFEHLDGAAPLWAKLWTKHNYDIDAIIANEPAVVLKKVAQELEEVVDDLQSGLMEGTKCNHTKEGKKCPVHGLEECGTYMEESSTINGRVQDPKEMVWKLSDMDHDEAVKKYGKENVRKGPKTRRGDPTVEIKRPLKDSVTEESQFDEDLASMKKIAGIGAVAAAGLGAHISGENAEIRAKEVEKLEKQVASEPNAVKRGQLEKMIKDIQAGKPLSKGDIISEVNPYRYDSDVDYYDAEKAEQARLRGDHDEAEEAHIADREDQRRYDHQAAWDDMYEDAAYNPDSDISTDWYLEVIDELIQNNRRMMSPSRKNILMKAVQRELALTAKRDGMPYEFNQDKFDEAYSNAVAHQRGVGSSRSSGWDIVWKDQFDPSMHDRIKNATPEELYQMGYEIDKNGAEHYAMQLKSAQDELRGLREDAAYNPDSDISTDWYLEVIDELIQNNRRMMSPSRRGIVMKAVQRELALTAKRDGMPYEFNQDKFDEAYSNAVGFRRGTGSSKNNGWHIVWKDQFDPSMHDRIKNATPEELYQMGYEIDKNGAEHYALQLKLAQDELRGLAEGLGSMIKRGVKKIQGTNRVEKAYTAHLNKAAAGGDDKEIGRAMKALYVGGADTAEKAYDQYHTKKYGHAPSRQQWTGDDEMDEGNEFSGALAKAKAAHKDSFEVDGKTYPVKESRSAVDELAECYDMAYQQAQSEPEQQGRMTVSANTSTEGTRSLSVNAEGDMADELAQLLSLSGLAGGHRHQEEMEESAQDEFHASTRPAPTTFSVSSQLKTGNDLNRPKVQHPAAAARGDNPLTR
jgi:hypothetical protein